jgi:formylglycine-generating enzyme required for sulfatase activity
MPDAAGRDSLSSHATEPSDPIVRQFDQDWIAGRRPAIEPLLPRDADRRRAILPALIRLELKHRLAAGEPARVEDYLARFPELTLEPDTLLDLVRLEQQCRTRNGPVPADEYSRRFPDLITARDLEGDSTDPVDFRAATIVSHPSKADVTPPPAEAPTVGYTTPADAPPPLVHGYDVLNELGRGGMGVVYKARHLNLNRIVALKLVRAGAHAAAEELVRFRQEAELVARLDHPNIVQIYDIGAQAGNSYLALEYLAAGTLARRLGGTPLPPKEAAGLVETLARAVHYAHQKGVIHRDLKPSNILLDESGVPKITDFGLARRVETDSGLTRTGAVMGTPSYMAPEQAEGKKDIGPAADIYALGATLYDLLTGRPPFRGASIADTIFQVLHHDPVPPRRLQPTVPRELQIVCLKALQKQPGQRYPSALALADDLHRFLTDQPILARAPSLADRAGKAIRRNRTAVLAAGAAAVVGLAVIAGLLWSAERSRARQIAVLVADGEAELALGVGATDAAADPYFESAAQKFAAALAIDPKARATEDALINVYLQRCRRALDRGDHSAARVLLLPLKNQDRTGRFTAEVTELETRIRGHGSWHVATSPPGADVTLTPLDADLVPGKPVKLGRTPLDVADLSPGSYVADVTAPDHAPVTVPLLWARGEAKQSMIRLVPRDQVPEGMVIVPGGPCILGDPATGRRQVVEVPTFFVDRTEVTGAEFERFVAATGADPPDKWRPGKQCPEHLRDQAVYNVSWFQAMEYARWAGKRLPTAAEWEKAARGVDGRHFPWGNKFDPALANFRDSPHVDGLTVGRKRRGASPYGCLDMAGNVWEWTLDREKRGATQRVIRGGASYSSPEELLVYRRHGAPPGGSDYGGSNLLGFRCVKALRPEPTKPTLIDELGPGDLADAAEYYWDHGHIARTRHCADRLRSLNPRSVAGNFWLALCLEKDGKTAEALPYMKVAFAQHPVYRNRNRSAANELVRLMAATGKAPDRTVLDILTLVNQARIELDGGRPAEAGVTLKRILTADPDHPVANEMMADVCIALNRPPDEAAGHRQKRTDAYRKELLEAPDDAARHIEFAEYLAHTAPDRPDSADRLAEALALVRTAVELEPLEPAHRAQHAAMLARLGKWSEAETEIRAAIDLDPEKEEYREALRSYQANRKPAKK